MAFPNGMSASITWKSGVNIVKLIIAAIAPPIPTEALTIAITPTLINAGNQNPRKENLIKGIPFSPGYGML